MTVFKIFSVFSIMSIEVLFKNSEYCIVFSCHIWSHSSAFFGCLSLHSFFKKLFRPVISQNESQIRTLCFLLIRLRFFLNVGKNAPNINFIPLSVIISLITWLRWYTPYFSIIKASLPIYLTCNLWGDTPRLCEYPILSIV